jgi:hypothetical protein
MAFETERDSLPEDTVQYEPAMNKLAFKLCLLGHTQSTIATFIGVSTTTLNNWMKKYPDFHDAIKNGTTLADANVAAALYNRAIGTKIHQEKVVINPTDGSIHRAIVTESIPADVKAATFWLTNRQRKIWSNTDRLEHSGLNSAPIIIEFAKKPVNKEESEAIDDNHDIEDATDSSGV